jgi:hypothetical protein
MHEAMTRHRLHRRRKPRRKAGSALGLKGGFEHRGEPCEMRRNWRLHCGSLARKEGSSAF